MMRVLGSERRWPGSPAASSRLAIDAAWPIQMVLIGFRRYCARQPYGHVKAGECTDAGALVGGHRYISRIKQQHMFMYGIVGRACGADRGIPHLCMNKHA